MVDIVVVDVTALTVRIWDVLICYAFNLQVVPVRRYLISSLRDRVPNKSKNDRLIRYLDTRNASHSVWVSPGLQSTTGWIDGAKISDLFSKP
jgi:hypothetical protein